MSVSPFEPGPSLARISATPCGWILDCRTDGEAAELAIVLRDQGGWSLRYSPAAQVVRKLVDDLSGWGRA